MKVVFEGEQEREWNKLNVNSVKFRTGDLDEIEKMQGIIFYDDNGKKISDAEIYLPQEKAYIIINRVHFGEAGKVFSGDKKDILKRMITYLLYPGNLRYLASAVYVDIVESGIPSEIIEELGFYPRDSYMRIFRLINNNFEQFLEHAPVDETIKNKMLQTYRELIDKDKVHLDLIRKELERAKEGLQSFTEQGNETMIEAKKTEIEHYEAILGNRQKREER